MPSFLFDPSTLPAAIACLAGFLIGFRVKRAAVIGLAIALASFVLILGDLFISPVIIEDCRTEVGRGLLRVSTYLATGLSWVTGIGIGLMLSRVWIFSRSGAALAIGAVALASMPYSSLVALLVAFKPGCSV